MQIIHSFAKLNSMENKALVTKLSIVFIAIVVICIIIATILLTRINTERYTDITDTAKAINVSSEVVPKEENQYIFNSRDAFINTRLNFIPNTFNLDQVDFTKQSLVILTVGQRSTGGYSLLIEQIKDYDKKIVIDIVENQPGENCQSTQEITSPILSFTFENPDRKDIEFSYRKLVKNCDLTLN
jgi:hypothetical protein